MCLKRTMFPSFLSILFYTFQLHMFTNHDTPILCILTNFFCLIVSLAETCKLKSLSTSIDLFLSYSFCQFFTLYSWQTYYLAHTNLGFLYLPAEFNHLSPGRVSLVFGNSFSPLSVVELFFFGLNWHRSFFNSFSPYVFLCFRCVSDNKHNLKIGHFSPSLTMSTILKVLLKFLHQLFLILPPSCLFLD